ncbi:phage major capsid protein [Pseudoroseomonas cervicalis]|uniref:phage major capsid protein n=1 Tax=Teichococcus cervicalis TaxID=204525 RepID=UPI0027897721|nr:phage major capsid protein [Pseudoroseomonas cervicalis]MDQ1078000.1 HK97 family phage major capsid protein [Pseudoroseomonas cervicalis]
MADIDLGQLATELKAATDSVKKHAETTMTELKNLGKVTEETKASADRALAEMNAISARMTEVEQKMARRGGDGRPDEPQTIGEMVLGSDDVKAALAQRDLFKGRVSVEVKAITSAATTVGSGVSGTTSLVPADRRPGMIMLPDRRLTVRDLLMPGRTTSGVIEYPKETLFTNNAAPVAETAQKPESNMTFEQVTTPVRVIAHWVAASKQILSDAPMLQSYIDGRLRYGLAFKEEQQLLTGDGTGQNLLGIMPQATTFAAPAGAPTTTTHIDKLRVALLQAALAEYPSTGMVLNPIDWTTIELTKDTTGQYIIGNPQGTLAPTLWGLPVVATQAMAQNNFLVGAFRLGAQIFDRWDATVLISTENADNFVKNMVTILAEERLGLAVYRPQAFVKGTLVTA